MSSYQKPQVAAVEARGVSKAFAGVQALRHVDFALLRGEVHALVGENGAGKSTLIKTLAGIHAPDAGEILLGGNAVSITGPRHAKQLGLSFVFQELATVPDFTVAEYMHLGQRYETRGGVLVSWRSINTRAEQIAERIGFDFDVTAKMRDLTVAQQRLAEIGLGLTQGMSVLVLDEPTAALAEREVERLLSVVRQLRGEGVGVIYVSHRLDEIYAVADRVTVFRDGEKVGTHGVADIPRANLVREIVGTDLFAGIERSSKIGAPVLEASGISTDRISNIGFTLREGEVLGLAGLVGSGRTEVVRAIFGADRVSSGNVVLRGKPVKIRSPRGALRHGIGLMPEERKTEGLLAAMSVRENVTIGSLGKYTGRQGLISKAQERKAIEPYVERLALKTSGPEAPVSSLSGGNQQKVVLSRLIDSGSRILLLDEPTKGVDVGAKQEMFQLVREFADEGASIIFISSDLDEIAEVCDRALVLREGQIVGELGRSDLSKASILALAYEGSNA